jgi:signal transduction histidine kinase
VEQLVFKKHLFWLERRRWREDRQAILEFNRSLALIADPDALMASIAARIYEIFDTDRIVILTAPTDVSAFSVAFSLGYAAEQVKDIHITRRDRLARWLLTNEVPLDTARDTNVFNYLSAPERDILTGLDVRVCVPLLALNRLTGMALLSSTTEGWRLNQEDVSLLQMLMSQAGIAFENASLFRQENDRLRKLYRAERLASAGRMAADVAHEIRNPLTAIRSTVQYLLGEFNESHPKRSLVEGVLSEVDRINHTVDSLLSLTRHGEFKAERIDLRDLLEQSVLFMRAQAHNQSVELALSAPASEIYVMGDASQLKQIMINLILNALQAMPDGGNLTLELSVRRDPGLHAEKSWAHLSLTDTGCGIPAEQLDKVFDPFFTTKQGGTGLGLSISYAIVQQHGGEFEINSSEGEGTTISILLPIEQVIKSHDQSINSR